MATMQIKGYEPQDNFSRILEPDGLLFTKAAPTDYPSVTATISLNTEGSVRIRYAGGNE
jgi:hypothetical protein